MYQAKFQTTTTKTTQQQHNKRHLSKTTQQQQHNRRHLSVGYRCGGKDMCLISVGYRSEREEPVCLLTLKHSTFSVLLLSKGNKTQVYEMDNPNNA